MDLLDRFLEHDRWTTGTLLDLRRALPDDQLDQEFDIGHRTLRATFAHMIDWTEAWVATMAGEPFPPVETDHSIASLIAWHERASRGFAAFARGVREEQRDDETFDDDGVARAFGTTISHVLLHNHLHRSEALHILQRLGVPDLPEGDPLEWEVGVRGAD